ncbi:MAG: hypothetical protein M3033_05055 [Acidobacteriota bacterium]|nr:hypothetical protein [Acidobacteriota bacterium]
MIDMSPEAIANRLKIMEQLWELSVSLMRAKPLENDAQQVSEMALPSEILLEKD